MSELYISGELPVLALRGLAVFPDQTVHFEVGRKKSILALDEAMKKDQSLLLIPQRDITVDDPVEKDLYPIGTVARVKQVLKTQGETIRVLVTFSDKHQGLGVLGKPSVTAYLQQTGK